MDRHIGRNNVFFVTGARSGGSVANLLSKKLIDRYGSDKVYSYTFNAVSTINGNMIPRGVRLHNEPYFSIFNIYNDDNIGVMFTNERTNMYKYGTNIHMSLSDALRGRDGEKVGKVINKYSDSNYRLIKESFSDFIDSYLELINGKKIYGMAGELNLSNVFSGETAEDLEQLYYYWKELFLIAERDNIDELYEFSINFNIVNYRLMGYEINVLEDYIQFIDITRFTSYVILENHYFINDYNYKRKKLQEKLDSTILNIYEMGEWYVNHIPTYQTKKDVTNSHINSIRYYDENIKKKIKYKYIENESDSYKDDKDEENMEEKVKGIDGYIESYKNINRAYKEDEDTIKADSIFEITGYDNSNSRALYYIDQFGFNQFINERQMYEVERNYQGEKLDYNRFINYVGDDCSDFAIAIILYRSKGYRGQSTINDNNRIISKGIMLHDTSAHNMRIDNNFENAMYNLGYDKYALRDGMWVKFVLNKNTYKFEHQKIQFEGDDTILDFIEPGDLILCDRHAEFYLGYSIKKHNEVISEIYLNDEDRDINNRFEWRHSYNDTKQERFITFGWGDVSNSIPTMRSSFKYDKKYNCLRSTIHKDENMMNDNYHQYKEIYRLRR